MLFVFVPSVSVLTMKFSFPHLHFNLCSVEPFLYLILGPMIAVLPPRNVVFLHFLERPLHLHFRLVDIGIGFICYTYIHYAVKIFSLIILIVCFITFSLHFHYVFITFSF